MPFGVGLKKFPTFSEAMKDGTKEPAVTVTQGGSSRKDSGARVAARDADTQNRPSN